MEIRQLMDPLSRLCLCKPTNERTNERKEERNPEEEMKPERGRYDMVLSNLAETKIFETKT